LRATEELTLQGKTGTEAADCTIWGTNVTHSTAQANIDSTAAQNATISLNLANGADYMLIRRFSVMAEPN
jgi:hypothetical protein